MKKLKVGVFPYIDDGVQYVPKGYLQGIEILGGEAVVLHYETPLDKVEEILDSLDGLLVSGGEDLDPALYGAEREPETEAPIALRDALEMKMIPLCIQKKKPLFAICRGIQSVNVALGGTLIQDIPKTYGTKHWHKRVPGEYPPYWHTVRVEKDSILAKVAGAGALPVNSFHHQCLARVADALKVTAVADEGFPEAVELKEGGYLLAVQWHPEMMLESDEVSRKLFRFFGAAMRAQSSSAS